MLYFQFYGDGMRNMVVVFLKRKRSGRGRIQNRHWCFRSQQRCSMLLILPKASTTVTARTTVIARVIPALGEADHYWNPRFRQKFGRSCMRIDCNLS